MSQNSSSEGPELSKPRTAIPEARADSTPTSMTQPPAAYYTPPPSSTPSPPTGKPGRWRLAILGAAVAAGLILGGWYALAPTPPPTSVPVAAASQSQKVLSLAKADADLKATAYLKNLLAGKAPETSAADPFNAVNAEALKKLAATSPKLASDIQSGQTVLYRICLLDFLEEDGDRVELSVDGNSFGDVYIKNAGKELLIPLTPGTPAHMKLTATADGGGGVTVGFVSSLGEARTRVMNVGQSEQWVVTVQ